MRLPAPDHRLHGEPLDAGIGPSGSHPCLHRIGGGARGLGIGQPQYYPAKVRLVADIQRYDLDDIGGRQCPAGIPNRIGRRGENGGTTGTP